MTHLSLEQLLESRESGLEPGSASARAHLSTCAACQAEAMRLDQRAARIRALPSLRPARTHWPMLREKLETERHYRRLRWAGAAAVALAAGLALVVLLRHEAGRRDQAGIAIDSVIARSTQLEQLIQNYDPDRRVIDGTTALVAGQLEDRIAQVDHQLEAMGSDPGRRGNEQLLQLWRQRVGLLGALVDVHLTRASQVGF